MNKWISWCFLWLVLCGGICLGGDPMGRPSLFEEGSVGEWLEFTHGPDLPVTGDGAAGAYIGVHGGVLIFAGGSNFSAPIQDGGRKQYLNGIYVLDSSSGDAEWIRAGSLPFAVAHGTAVSIPDGVLCIGGETAEGPISTVFLLRWDAESRTVEIDPSPPDLPDARTYLSATRMGDVVFAGGGLDSGGETTEDFLSLSLRVPGSEWTRLPSWPGPARFGAVLAGQFIENLGFVYLFGGKNGDAYLRDGYRYDPRKRVWQAVAPLPRGAFLSPVFSAGQSRILVFSGSDGYRVDEWRELDSGYSFPLDVLSYSTITDTWAQSGRMETGIAGTSAVGWNGMIVFPGGELRPGVRTRHMLQASLIPTSDHFGLLDQMALAIYLGGLALLCIWLYFRHKKQNTTNNFYLAGRSLPGWAAGMSLMATAVSSIGFMAIPAKTFTSDWTYFAGVFTWVLVVPIVVIWFVPFFRRINVATAYELLENRFDIRIRTFTAIGFSLMEGGRMAIVLLLPATALATVTPLTPDQTVILMGISATVYAVVAGMRGVVWTDVIQGIVMIFGALLCVVMVVLRVDGGMAAVFSTAWEDGKFAFSMEWSPVAAGVWVVVVGNVFIRVATLTSSQSSVQRLLSTPGEKEANSALWTNALVSVPWAVIVFLLGTALYVFYKMHPSTLPPQLQDIEILPLFISQQLPPGLSGIVIAAIFAAGMSSLDTSMHSLSTTWTRDFFARFFPHYSDRVQLTVSKGLIILFGVIATGCALIIHHAGIRGMWDFFISLFGLFGGVLCGIFMLARFSRSATASGTLLGGFVSFALMILIWRNNWMHGLLYTAAGVVLCYALGWFFSLFFKGKSK